MAKTLKFFLISLAIAGLAAATAVYAEDNISESTDPATVNATVDQTETNLSPEATAAIETSADLAGEPEALAGVEIAKPTKMPSAFGLWWSNLAEKVSLALTVDPVKKSEKALQYAEAKVELANYITNNTTDPKLQEKAGQMLAKANEYLTKIESSQTDLLKNPNEKIKNLMNNLATHYANKEKVMEKLEDKIPADKLSGFQVWRQAVASSTQNFLNNLATNQNVPAEVKAKINEVKNSINAKLEAREEVRVEQKALLEKIMTGDQAAKSELEKLRQERLNNLEQVREQYKTKAGEIINQIKAGAPGAVESLKLLNQQGQAEMKNILEQVKIKATEIKDGRQLNKQEILNQIKELRPAKRPNQLNNSTSSPEGLNGVAPASPVEPAPVEPIQ